MQVKAEDQEDFIVIDITEEEAREAEQKNINRLRLFYQAASPYQIGNWINSLQNYTMPSYSFMLKGVQAYILHLMYYEEPLPAAIIPFLQSFQSKIDLFIKTHFSNGCFCKLTTRSPKDAMWCYQLNEIQSTVNNMIAFLAKENIKKITSEITPQLSHLFYKFLLEEKRNRLLIRNGKQFIDTFSKSDRIMIDLSDMSTLKGNVYNRCKQEVYETDALTTVWCRQWREMKWEEQFRCFYKDFTLTAITQYDENCYFPTVHAHKKNIRLSIQHFFQKILPKLRQTGLIDGVMDVLVKHSEQQKPPYDVELIEINIFNSNTRASLFKWDETVLFETVLFEGPLEIRVLEECKAIRKSTLSRMMGMISKGTDLILQRVCAALGGTQYWNAYH